MGVGRKSKPTILKVLQGNPGKRPLNKKEAMPAATMPDCPSHLSDRARREWARTGPILNRIGLLTEADKAAFAAYCVAYARWADAEEQLIKHGLLVKYPSKVAEGQFVLQQSPMLGIANRSMDQMKSFLSEMGMTPSSRSRIQVDMGGSQAGDGFQAFLKKKKN